MAQPQLQHRMLPPLFMNHVVSLNLEPFRTHAFQPFNAKQRGVATVVLDPKTPLDELSRRVAST